MRCVAVALAFAGVLILTPALAADKAGPAAPPAEDAVPLTKAYCYIEGSAGKNVTSSRISDQVNGSVTLSADGAIAGLGAGCDLDISRFFVGVFGRFDFTNVSGTFADAKLGQDNQWMAAGRGGFKLNYATRVYGLAGIAGTDLTYGDLKLSPDGVVYGLGIETDIGLYGLPNNISIGIEWDHIAWKKATEFESALRPDTDIIRATLKLKLDLFK